MWQVDSAAYTAHIDSFVILLAADLVACQFLEPLMFLPLSTTSRTLLAHLCKLLLHSSENVLPVCLLGCQALFAEVLGSRRQETFQ